MKGVFGGRETALANVVTILRHRLPDHRAIIVHYGLPNIGAEAVTQRLASCRRMVPVGVNLVNTNRLRSETEDVILDDFLRAKWLLNVQQFMRRKHAASDVPGINV